jgi:hypothetical protein
MRGVSRMCRDGRTSQLHRLAERRAIMRSYFYPMVTTFG